MRLSPRLSFHSALTSSLIVCSFCFSQVTLNVAVATELIFVSGLDVCLLPITWRIKCLWHALSAYRPGQVNGEAPVSALPSRFDQCPGSAKHFSYLNQLLNSYLTLSRTENDNKEEMPCLTFTQKCQPWDKHLPFRRLKGHGTTLTF